MWLKSSDATAVHKRKQTERERGRKEETERHAHKHAHKRLPRQTERARERERERERERPGAFHTKCVVTASLKSSPGSSLGVITKYWRQRIWR